MSITPRRAAYDATLAAHAAYRVAILNAVRVLVADTTADADTTLPLGLALNNHSTGDDVASELEEILVEFPTHARDAVRAVVVAYRAVVGANNAYSDLRR